MNYITVLTPENIEIQYRCSGLGSRMAAAAVDAIIILAIIAIISADAVLASVNNGEFFMGTVGDWVEAAWICLFFALIFGYFIISELVTKGQSVGKKIFKLRVISLNGNPITLNQSIARNLFRYFADIFGVGAIMIFYSKHNRRLGDLVAGTVVVDESLSELTATKTNGAFFSADWFALNDAEYDALNQYFNRKDNFVDNGELLKKELIRYFGCKFGNPPDEAALAGLLAANRR